MLDHSIFGEPEEPPPGIKIIKTRTTLKMNRRDGQVVKRKVRIIIKGYDQIPGVHFTDMYALVIRWETLHLLLAIGAATGADMCQFNIKSAYLHGMMQEEVWVRQPEGFEIPGKEYLPMQLLKAL